MTDKVNEQVSALLDNELSNTEIASVLNGLNQQHELRQTWDRYHLIGDVMRGESIQPKATEISERVRQQIELEPAIISMPRKRGIGDRKSPWVKPLAGAALAASVATVAVINAPGFLGLDQPATPLLTATHISTAAPANRRNFSGTRWRNLAKPSLQTRLNGYLIDHSGHVSTGTGMGVMPYATFVGYDVEH
ncbi:MAG: sigma-E factor negative regulatory protein [Gammaproteobacteria bacterium]|nr:sigma-E factor negative regulatory protein [Gammaproteobacteria bacterium]